MSTINTRNHAQELVHTAAIKEDKVSLRDVPHDDHGHALRLRKRNWVTVVANFLITSHGTAAEEHLTPALAASVGRHPELLHQ